MLSFSSTSKLANLQRAFGNDDRAFSDALGRSIQSLYRDAVRNQKAFQMFMGNVLDNCERGAIQGVATPTEKKAFKRLLPLAIDALITFNQSADKNRLVRLNKNENDTEQYFVGYGNEPGSKGVKICLLYQAHKESLPSYMATIADVTPTEENTEKEVISKTVTETVQSLPQPVVIQSLPQQQLVIQSPTQQHVVIQSPSQQQVVMQPVMQQIEPGNPQALLAQQQLGKQQHIQRDLIQKELTQQLQQINLNNPQAQLNQSQPLQSQPQQSPSLLGPRIVPEQKAQGQYGLQPIQPIVPTPIQPQPSIPMQPSLIQPVPLAGYPPNYQGYQSRDALPSQVSSQLPQQNNQQNQPMQQYANQQVPTFNQMQQPSIVPTPKTSSAQSYVPPFGYPPNHPMNNQTPQSSQAQANQQWPQQPNAQMQQSYQQPNQVQQQNNQAQQGYPQSNQYQQQNHPQQPMNQQLPPQFGKYQAYPVTQNSQVPVQNPLQNQYPGVMNQQQPNQPQPMNQQVQQQFGKYPADSVIPNSQMPMQYPPQNQYPGAMNQQQGYPSQGQQPYQGVIPQQYNNAGNW